MVQGQLLRSVSSQLSLANPWGEALRQRSRRSHFLRLSIGDLSPILGSFPQQKFRGNKYTALYTICRNAGTTQALQPKKPQTLKLQ